MADAGILSAEEHRDLTDALTRIERAHAGQPCPDNPAEDLHTWIESELTELAGDAGRKIHTARSRNDQVATLLVLYVRDAGAALAHRLGALASACARRAQDWSALIMPLQTHQQFAAPGSVGAWALRYAVPLARVRKHVMFLTEHWAEACPLGSGAVAGSSIAIDRGKQAEGLGFQGPSLSALASTSTRDECLELLAVQAQVALHLQAFAADVICFAQTPLGWVKYPSAFGTGSSMMPNKTNPDALELLRGECNRILAAQQEAVLLQKGLVSGYNRDLQCIKPLVRGAAERLDRLCALATDFIGELDFDAERLAAALPLGHIDATLRMEGKVTAGIPLRAAHHAVAADLAEDAAADAAAVAALADAYRTIGSASPTETRRVAEALLAELP